MQGKDGFLITKDDNGATFIFNQNELSQLIEEKLIELIKKSMPYIICEKCGSVYFTSKVKSTKTCPLCHSPSLEPKRRAIDKQFQRLYDKGNSKNYKFRFLEYLINKKHFNTKEARIELKRQLDKLDRRG